MKRLILLTVLVILVVSFPVKAEFLDEAPYWFWTYRWEGDLTIDFKDSYHKQYVTAEGYAVDVFKEEGRAEGKDVVFAEEKVKLTFKRWRGSGNVVHYNWKEEESLQGQDADAKGDMKVVAEGKADTFLDMESELVIDADEESFRITILFPIDFEVWLKRRLEIKIEGEVSYHQLENDHTEHSPHIQGEVVKELPQSGEGLDDTEDMNKDNQYDQYQFTYNFQPVYDQETRKKWAEDYHSILLSKRERYMKMWEDIKAKCESGEYSGIICRAANREEARMEKWLSALLEDGMRVCDALLNNEAPGLLPHIEKNYSGRTRNVVMKGAARTADLIHSYLFHFYDDAGTGSIDAIYERLPSEMKQIYSKDDLVYLAEAFLVYDSTIWEF